MEKSTRRYDLDQLRVLAFGVLILYHVGMFYVADWGWHIKSDRLRHLASLIWKDITPGTKFIWIRRGENRAGKVLG